MPRPADVACASRPIWPVPPSFPKEIAGEEGQLHMTIRAVRGVRDILPGEAAKWQRVEDTARRTFEAYGYAEIRLPLFERTELFARGIGEVTDIVQKEMYTFPGAGNGLRQTLNGHEAGNGGYSQ